MEFYKYIEQLRNIITNGSKIPFSSKIIIEKEQALDLIDALLRSLPEDLKDAKAVIEDRQKILIDAQNQAEIIIKEAQETIEKMVSEDEITKLAQEKSDQILSFTKQTAREIRSGANDYADEVLGQLDKQLTKLLKTVKRGREELKQNR